ncbi:MAG: beta-galactosidase trimerization domain-containing protein [Planctomycetes bacterium]|nr:beta-galactosidase trimerization domain-containing protein [Planctomycetota bacterium]
MTLRAPALLFAAALSLAAVGLRARGEEPAPEPKPKDLPPDTLTPLEPPADKPKPAKTAKTPPPAKTLKEEKTAKEEKTQQEEKTGEETPPPPPVKPENAPADTIEVPKEHAPPGVPIVPKGMGHTGEGELSEVRLMPEAGDFAPGEPAVFVLRGPDAFLSGAIGAYVLKDEGGREVARGTVKLAETKKAEDGSRRFSVKTDLAVECVHILTLSLVGADDRRIERSAAFRIPRNAGWDGWITLIDAPYPGGHWRALAQLGVRGGMAYRMNAERFAALKMAGVPYYVENIARQFLSRYHAERGLWEKTLSELEKNPDAREPLARAPSFCSRSFAEAYAKELQRHAAQYKSEGPLFYSLASEPSVTRLAAAFDFDFHPEAMDEFRRWLERDAYGTLSALNEYWGTSFKSFAEAVPMTTPEARMRLKDGVNNYAPWVDFRAFQDLQFARTLREGAAVIRREDPKARVGITGAMGPFAFGGWDWTRLADALDVVEAYDIGGARALWRDLAPGKPALAMLPLPADPADLQETRRALWTLALDGGPRGALLWDEAPGPDGGRILLDADGKPTAAANVLAPALRELAGPLGMLTAKLRRNRGGVAILYSPASIRVNWLFEADQLHGDEGLKAWGADTSAERRESLQLRLRESWCKLLADLGLPWRFVSSAQLENGELADPNAGLKAVVLPRACALSDKEAEALKAFAAAGGLVVADAFCGRFDEHGRERKKPALDELFGVNTAHEPFAPEPERLLEGIRDRTAQGQEGILAPNDAGNLPPPYSDKPLWNGEPPARRCEYREAPVLVRKAAGKGAAVYLNLCLDDYLRWRLHPEAPRASVTRGLLDRLAFAPLRAELPVDLSASTLPLGTELIGYTLGEGPKAVRVLALRRNFQARLHELGKEGDSNEALDHAEPFKLVLREKCWVANLCSDKPGAQTGVLEGTLDPVSPSLYALRKQNSPVPTAVAPVDVKPGDRLAVQILPGPGADQGPRVYGLRVLGPDGAERIPYGGMCLAPDGKWNAAVPLAYNDPPGTWTFIVRDASTGLESKLAVNVLKGE